jgi:pyruvate kinase
MLKPVATLGPATDDAATIAAIVERVDRLRLNSSHLDARQLLRWLEQIDAVFSSLGKTIAVVVDLQGAKMRIGGYPRVEQLPDRVSLRCQAEASSDPGLVPVPHEELFEVVEPGELLELNDGRVRLQVEHLKPGEIAARVLVNGPLSGRKGINRPRHPLPYHRLTPADEEAINTALRFDFVQLAFSFVHTGDEAACLRAAAGSRRTHLVAKIERPEAFDHLQSIDERFDELWLCRGDLGSQAGLRRLAQLQETFTQRIAELRRPAYLAGQVLQHMTEHDHPTRSEVVHLFDIERRGYAGVVLSDETAIGRYPLQTVELLHQLGLG